MGRVESVEDNQKQTTAAAIPTAASFGETVRGPGLYALLVRSTGIVKIPLRFISAQRRAELDALHPDPFPPKKFNPSGAAYMDVYDEKFIKGRLEAEQLRLKERIAELLPDEFMGTSDAAEKIRMVWSRWGEDDIVAIDRQGRNPYETREEGVQAQEEQHSPFVATSSGESPG